MKLNTTLLLLSAFLLTVMLLPGCKDRNGGNGQIPYNEERARKHVIPINEAKQLQENFIRGRTEMQRLLGKDSSFLNSFKIPNAESFNRDAIALLLNVQKCDGIRIYYGKDSTGEFRLVILPIDSSGRDIYTNLITRKSNAIRVPGIPSAQAAPYIVGEAIETGQICPPCKIQ